MPAKAPPIKLLQLKLPGYSGRSTPERFETWLASVVNLNKKENRSLLTEVNVKRAWTDTLRAHSLDNRLEEMNSKAGKSAMLSMNSKAQLTEQNRANANKNSRGKWHTPNVPEDLDISEYKIPYIGALRFLEAVKYRHFAKQVQQANLGKPFSQEVVEACFWSMIDELVKKAGRNSSTAPVILKEAKGIMTKADAYWASVESLESVPQ